MTSQVPAYAYLDARWDRHRHRFTIAKCSCGNHAYINKDVISDRMEIYCKSRTHTWTEVKDSLQVHLAKVNPRKLRTTKGDLHDTINRWKSARDAGNGELAVGDLQVNFIYADGTVDTGDVSANHGGMDAPSGNSRWQSFEDESSVSSVSGGSRNSSADALMSTNRRHSSRATSPQSGPERHEQKLVEAAALAAPRPAPLPPGGFLGGSRRNSVSSSRGNSPQSPQGFGDAEDGDPPGGFPLTFVHPPQGTQPEERAWWRIWLDNIIQFVKTAIPLGITAAQVILSLQALLRGEIPRALALLAPVLQKYAPNFYQQCNGVVIERMSEAVREQKVQDELVKIMRTLEDLVEPESQTSRRHVDELQDAIHQRDATGRGFGC